MVDQDLIFKLPAHEARDNSLTIEGGEGMKRNQKVLVRKTIRMTE